MSKKVHGVTAIAVSAIFSKRTRLVSEHACFNIKAFPWQSTPCGLDPNNDFRATFIAGKKALGKLAVYRNKAERRVKASISTVFPNDALKGYDYIVFLKPAAVVTKWSDLQAQVQEAASRIKYMNSKRTSPGKPIQTRRTPVV